MQPEVSVIIASHRPEYIAGCVASFGNETCGSTVCEVVVVVDYHLSDFPKRFPGVKWVYHPDKSIPAKRNRGILESCGGIVGFIDDDCRPQSSWISNAVVYLEENTKAAGVEGFTGVESAGDAGPSIGQFRRLESRGYRTNNIFYRRAALLDAGMFDERFTVQREDVDLAFTMLEKGFDIGYCGNIRVNHLYRRGEKWDLLKNCWNRRFDPLLYRKHRRLYRKHIKSPFTPVIALILFSYIAAAWMCRFRPVLCPVLALSCGAVVFAVTARRVSRGVAGPVQWIRELAACALSPLVMLSALFYGSVRFRSPLIF